MPRKRGAPPTGEEQHDEVRRPIKEAGGRATPARSPRSSEDHGAHRIPRSAVGSVTPQLQERVLTDSDVRYLAVSMVNAETERDRQQQIGASTLSNPCDNCLAAEFLGQSRFDEFADRPFLGRSLGTLMHNGLEQRQHIAQAMFPGALMEQKVTCATIPGYGEIPGHFDLQPTAGSIVDWKGSLRKRIALLEDFLQSTG